MAERTCSVTGMSCGHCAASITEEVRGLAGVAEVDVDLTAGAVTVRGRGVDDGAVRAAIAEAGYEVTGAGPAAAA
ncbi:heavy-metal-associated domain-containing protein [Streptomyces poriticola]|uniref:heavy-metal-associated domain-containing protein n=1 Tax=Streptomyces poriticola TaxID=3120506 RepID=UPI002FCE263E